MGRVEYDIAGDGSRRDFSWRRIARSDIRSLAHHDVAKQQL